MSKFPKNKIISFGIILAIMFFADVFFYSNLSYAAVSLPWSSTYNCADWTQGQALSCDGISTYGDWTTSAGSKEQITAAANYPGGGGGKGQRQWNGDGMNNNSGNTSITFNSEQTELWVRWYMRYEAGYTWNPLMMDKLLYFTDTPIEYYGYDGITIISNGYNYGNLTSGSGWDTVMVNGGTYTTTSANGATPGVVHKTSDGQWHAYELHMKMDTNGSNGVGEIWIDGVLKLSRTDINYTFTDPTEIGWRHFLIGSNQAYALNGRDMYVDFDDIAVSTTGYIGPIGGGGDITTPTQPANLNATAQSATQINLTWTASTDAVGVTSYTIERCAGAGCTNFLQAGTVTGTPPTATYSDTGLTGNTTYSYRVKALDAAANASTLSSIVSATTQVLTDSTPPSTPANLTANVISASQINLTWSASTDNVGVTGYKIYRNGTQITTTNSTTYSNTGLTASTAYSYTVSAYDAAGNNSTQSTSASATTQALQTSTTLFQESFEDTSFASRGWYDGTTLKLSTTEKYSGNSSVEYHFLPGATKPEISGGAIRKLFTSTDEVYVSYWVKYSSNWTGSNKPYHPHEFLILTNENGVWDGPAYTKLTAYIEQNEGTPLLSLQDGMNIDLTKINQDLTTVTENRAIAGCNGVPTAENTTYVDCYPSGADYWNGKAWKANQIYFQDAPGAYYKNNWHHVEGYFKLNTISGGKGQPDGIVKYWYDGNLLIEKTNIIMRTAQYPNMKFNQFMIAPWIGDGSPIDQTFWVDGLTLATSRPTQQDTTPPAAPTGLAVN